MLGVVVQGLLNGLTDPMLPVQSAAACAIRQLIGTEGTKDMLRPFLPQLVSHYFRIMHEVENEEVLMSLQTIVEVYGDEISPLAVQMTQHLLAAFEQFRGQAGEEEDEQSIFNASQCLDTILAILEVNNHCGSYIVVYICLLFYNLLPPHYYYYYFTLLFLIGCGVESCYYAVA